MAGQIAHESNLASKGRTDSLTANRRKKRGLKAKPHGKSKPPGSLHGTPPQGCPLPKDPK